MNTKKQHLKKRQCSKILEIQATKNHLNAKLSVTVSCTHTHVLIEQLQTKSSFFFFFHSTYLFSVRLLTCWSWLATADWIEDGSGTQRSSHLPFTKPRVEDALSLESPAWTTVQTEGDPDETRAACVAKDKNTVTLKRKRKENCSLLGSLFLFAAVL